MSEEKTESPTEKKLRDARLQGAALKSQDIVDSMSLLAVVVLMISATSWLAGHFNDILAEGLAFVDGDHDDTALLSALWRILRSALIASLAVVAAAAGAALLALALQVGFHPTLKPVTPRLENVNPVAGFKRLFSLRALLDLAKSIVKALIFLWIGGLVLAWLLPIALAAAYQPVRELAHLAWQACMRLLQFWLGVYLVIGLIDWFLQRMVFLRSQRMSKDEVKREHKNDEGDPIIKGERRKLQRSSADGPEPSPKAAMHQASVLVTNPTHYAVALRYHPQECPVPQILATGMDEQAAVLRELARREDVPIVANPPLARALYQAGPGAYIPEPLFEAVAAVLRWVLATAHLEQSSTLQQQASDP
ncbi:Flagellar biosynthesis protein FlhB [plant metagenome]|uniref:Flagellar biosynthesis protein FlhB n=1 Tax=plant metagenome TaxID=1297885 RepID=A0A484NUR6_9ZZZZ